ncbi:MAG TPA: NAD-dependent epimerase/dehydratase family protein, partial [Actinomycetota bacterium]|nr:NAD-dependent epimerase/dehydratase family protein [Actinomycetota bacterium]
MSTYFVSGGSGFVGGRVIRDLRARGDAVYALARTPKAAERIRRAGAEPVDGELEDPEALRDGMRGADVVIHAGAKVDDWGRAAEFERVNVEGTRNVLWAMRQAGVPRVVFVSPVTVLAAGRPLVRVDESTPAPHRALGWYHRSKLESERALFGSDGEGLEAIVVRFAMAWGPGDRPTIASSPSPSDPNSARSDSSLERWYQ